MQIVSYELISTFWASKFPARWCYHYWFIDMIKHSQSTQSNKLAFFFLKHLIKEVRSGIHCFACRHYFFIKKDRHVQSTQNRKLVIFLQYIKKALSQLFLLFYFDAKYSDILRTSNHAYYYLFIIITETWFCFKAIAKILLFLQPSAAITTY